ncbi:MAG: Txe/YoeB family addiction module toxin [Nitrospirota bacterium]
MQASSAEHAWEDYIYWQRNDKKTFKLIKDIQKNKYQGIGKPEPLKHSLTGYWSRRITNEHRIVCEIHDKQVLIVQLRYHY